MSAVVSWQSSAVVVGTYFPRGAYICSTPLQHLSTHTRCRSASLLPHNSVTIEPAREIPFYASRVRTEIVGDVADTAVGRERRKRETKRRGFLLTCMYHCCRLGSRVPDRRRGGTHSISRTDYTMTNVARPGVIVSVR